MTPPLIPASYADERRHELPASKGGVRLVPLLEVGQPRERLLRERAVLFLAVFAVVRLRAVVRFPEAFATVAFARFRGALPFPLDRERVCCSRCCSRCCCCVRSIFARPMTLPSGSAKSA